MINVKLCSTFQEAKNTLERFKKNYGNDVRVAAVETEYGNEVFGVKHGATVEFNHHGKLKNKMPACLAAIQKTQNTEPIDFFIISHLDLDTIFGIMWAGGYLKNTYTTRVISELVAYLDTNSFYDFKNNIFDENNKNHITLLAITSLMNFWTFSKKTLSKDIHKLILRIRDYIIGGVPQEVKKFIKIGDDTILENFIIRKFLIPKILIVYVAPTSMTDRYFFENLEYDLILQYNTSTRSITLTCKNEILAKNYFGKNGVITPLQEFFGKSSGGHISIGGSPRDKKLPFEYLEAFYKFLKREYLNI